MLRWRLNIKESVLNNYFGKTKIQNSGNKAAACFYYINIILKKGLFKFGHNLGLHFKKCFEVSKGWYMSEFE